MAVSIAAPKLGWATEPVELVEWKAKEGDRVEQGSIVLVVTTGKITSDVEAEASGYLHILLEEGNQAPIGSAVGLIAETREELEKVQKESPKEIAVSAAESEETLPEAVSPVQAVVPEPVQTRGEGRIRISPLARRLAEERMIDIATIVGTGPQGRIVREDVEQAIEAKQKAEVTPDIHQGKRVKSTRPLKGMQKAIAEHMHRSLQVSAQVTVMGEIDASALVKWRQSLVAQAETVGAKVTYTDLFVFIVARVLKEHSAVNSSLIDNEIKLWDSVNIGVAVALEEGLVVPVVKDADKKSLAEINQTVRTLVERARTGKLLSEDISGGTLTITNLGALGGGYRFETVILNQPESAIFGTGGITERAVVRDGQIVARPIMTYYFTYDHRVITGAVAARFMADVTKCMETPALLIV